MWALREFQLLEGIHDARRAAGYLCQVSKRDYTRSMGVLSNCAQLQGKLFVGWPNLVRERDTLTDKGPLSKSCPCGRNRSPLIGVSDSDEFHTSKAHALGIKFWELCVYDVTLLNRGSIPLGMEGSQTDFALLESVGVSPFLSFSLASGVSSWRSTCEAWKAGTLTRFVLVDLADADRCDAFFSSSSGNSLLSTPRSRLCSLWKVSSVSTSASSSRLSSVSSCSPLAKLPSFLSSNARSRLTQTTMSDPCSGSVSFPVDSHSKSKLAHTPVGLDGSCSVPVGDMSCAGPLHSDELTERADRPCIPGESHWIQNLLMDRYGLMGTHLFLILDLLLSRWSWRIAFYCGGLQIQYIHASRIHKIWRSRALLMDLSKIAMLLMDQTRGRTWGWSCCQLMSLLLVLLLPLPLQQQSWTASLSFPHALHYHWQINTTAPSKNIPHAVLRAPRTCSTKPHFYCWHLGKARVKSIVMNLPKPRTVQSLKRIAREGGLWVKPMIPSWW